MKHILLLLLTAFPTCRHCEPQIYDAGPLPSEAFLCVPYEDGKTTSLTHSNGKTINFAISREVTAVEWVDCMECCITFKHEEELTSLKPDYPLFEIRISIVNHDTAHYDCSVWIDGANFYIPTNDYTREYTTRVDSMLIGGKYYYDLFLLPDANDYMQKNPVRIDSLYYNFSDGIVKITMTNDEYYQIIY